MLGPEPSQGRLALMSGRRTAAEPHQDGRLPFVPLWPIVGILILFVLLVALVG